jgi:hypothetical protein
VVVERDDMAIGYIDEIDDTITCREKILLDTVDILVICIDFRVDALEPPIVERLMKLRLILVEKEDIVERRL